MLRGFWLERQYVSVAGELRRTDGRIVPDANWDGRISAVMARGPKRWGCWRELRRQTKMDRLPAVRYHLV